MPAPGCMTLRHFVLIYSAATQFVSENQSNWASRNRSRKKAARAAFKSFEIGANPLRHNQDQSRVSHIHPIAARNKLIRGIPYERTIGINC